MNSYEILKKNLEASNNDNARMTYVRDLKLGDVQRHGSIVSPEGFTYTIITNIETVPNKPRSRRITKTSPDGYSYSIVEGLNARVVTVHVNEAN